MKCVISISFNVMLLLVFTIASPTPAWACGKSSHKKEAQYHQSKCPSNCQKECCKKPCADSKNKKKKCCGGDCACSTSTIVIADLPKQFSIDNFLKKPVFISKTVFSYREINSKSTIQDIWQPPITLLSVWQPVVCLVVSMSLKRLNSHFFNCVINS